MGKACTHPEARREHSCGDHQVGQDEARHPERQQDRFTSVCDASVSGSRPLQVRRSPRHTVVGRYLPG